MTLLRVTVSAKTWNEGEDKKLAQLVEKHGALEHATLERLMKRSWFSLSARIQHLIKRGTLPADCTQDPNAMEDPMDDVARAALGAMPPIVSRGLPTSSAVDASGVNASCLSDASCALVCYTTYARRLNSSTRHVLRSLNGQITRQGGVEENRVAVILPPGVRWYAELAPTPPIIVRMAQDFGPASKLIGCLQAAGCLGLPPSTRVVVTTTTGHVERSGYTS